MQDSETKVRGYLGTVRAYLSLGGNLGDREVLLREAVRVLAEQMRVRRLSPVYETDPWGYTDQAPFLNLVAEVETDLPPANLLLAAQATEQALGRERVLRWGPRTVDVDILLYGDRQLDRPELTVPHPRLGERAFVLVPLADLAPDLIIPGHGLTVREALARLPAAAKAGVRCWAEPWAMLQ